MSRYPFNEDGRFDRYCPTCRAYPGSPCRTQSGRRKAEPHAARTRTPSPIRNRQGTVGARRKFSQAVKALAAGWCEAHTPDCQPGRHRGQHAHHVLSRGRGGSNDPTNGLWVCWEAHDWIHDHPREAEEAGWLAKSA